MLLNIISPIINKYVEKNMKTEQKEREKERVFYNFCLRTKNRRISISQNFI